MTVMKKRNGELDFWKFVASLSVAVYHSHTLFKKNIIPTQCALAVEFFFMVTGFLLAASVYRDERPYDSNSIGTETLQFIRHKINAFFPMWVYGFGLTLLIKIISTKGKIILPENWSKLVFDFMLLKSVGFPIENVVTASWYLSCMLLVLFMIYPLIRRNRDAFSSIVAPIVGLVVLGEIFRGSGSLLGSFKTDLITKSFLRAVSEICMGVFAYVLAKRLKEKQISDVTRYLLSAIDLLSVLGAFAIMIFGTSESQPLLLLLFFTFVVISGSGQAKITDLYCNRFSIFLGKMSLSVYLTHCAVRALFVYLNERVPCLKSLFHSKTPEKLLLALGMYLGTTFVLALFGQWLTECIEKSKNR